MYSLAEISNSSDDYFTVGSSEPSGDLSLSGGSQLEIENDLPNDQAIAFVPPAELPNHQILVPHATPSSMKNAIVVPLNNIRKRNLCTKKRAQKVAILLSILLILTLLFGISKMYKIA